MATGTSKTSAVPLQTNNNTASLAKVSEIKYNDDQINTVFATFMNGITESEILDILPTGLKTAEGIYLRARAYDVAVKSGREMIAFIIDKRKDPDYYKHVGHKRNIMMAFIAIIVIAAQSKNVRPINERMQKMITDAFPLKEMKKVIYLLSSEEDSVVDWVKDGQVKKVRCNKLVAENDEVKKWIANPWPPMRNQLNN